MKPIITTTPFTRLDQLALGDIITLPDGKALTVRAAAPQLAHTVGQMAGFILCGEVGPSCVLLSLPAELSGPVLLYRPLDRVPNTARSAVEVIVGVLDYWAPHLPGQLHALGQLGFKVCIVRGQVNPMVVFWRGRELVVFVESGVCSADQIKTESLKRDARRTSAPVTRVSSVVVGADQSTDASLAENSLGLYEKFTRK